MLKNFLTEEAEDARNIAGRRPALFAADEDDEVKKFEARRLRRRAQRPDKACPRQSLLFLLSFCSKADVESKNPTDQEARQW